MVQKRTTGNSNLLVLVHFVQINLISLAANMCYSFSIYPHIVAAGLTIKQLLYSQDQLTQKRVFTTIDLSLNREPFLQWHISFGGSLTLVIISQIGFALINI